MEIALPILKIWKPSRWNNFFRHWTAGSWSEKRETHEISPTVIPASCPEVVSRMWDMEGNPGRAQSPHWVEKTDAGAQQGQHGQICLTGYQKESCSKEGSGDWQRGPLSSLLNRDLPHAGRSAKVRAEPLGNRRPDTSPNSHRVARVEGCVTCGASRGGLRDRHLNSASELPLDWRCSGPDIGRKGQYF